MVPATVTIDDFSHWVRGSGLEIVLLIVGAVLLTRFATWFGQRLTARIELVSSGSPRDGLVRSEQSKHLHSLTQVITWTLNVLIVFVVALLVLRRLEVPLTSLVAPATVIGVAVGFGAQRVVQDLLAGFFLISERQYGFGDVVRISPPGTSGGVSGTVEDVTLRVTRLRTQNGELLTLPNGEIRQVTNLSRDWARVVIDVPVATEIAITRINDILKDVGEQAFADPAMRALMLDPPTVMGVESIDVGSYKVRVVARTLPGTQFDVGRELRARIARAFQEAGIGLASAMAAASAAAS
jgi:small conductance mechanosensitive channel